jgi:hypothetical protein
MSENGGVGRFEVRGSGLRPLQVTGYKLDRHLV